MKCHGQAQLLPIALAVALAACQDAPTEPAQQPAFGVGDFRVLVWPDVAALSAGQTQSFGAYISTQDSGLGPDGVPGTADDDYQPATAVWTVVGDIGSVSPTIGTNTTFGASLPEGRRKARGRVVADLDGGVADADIQVLGDPAPIGGRELCATFGDGAGSKVFCDPKSVRFYVDFASTGATATFDGGSTNAPDGATKAEVRFTDEKVSGLSWYGAAGLIRSDAAARGSVFVKFEFPGGLITGAQWGGSKDIGLGKRKKYDEVDVRYE